MVDKEPKKKEVKVLEIMSFANPDYLKRLGLKQDLISFAGGWVNHSAPDEMQNSYLKHKIW